MNLTQQLAEALRPIVPDMEYAIALSGRANETRAVAMSIRLDALRAALAAYEASVALYGGNEALELCARACQGISTVQLERMPPGTLADAYDVCSDMVEEFGFAVLETVRDTGHYPQFEIDAENAERLCMVTGWAREPTTTQPEH